MSSTTIKVKVQSIKSRGKSPRYTATLRAGVYPDQSIRVVQVGDEQSTKEAALQSLAQRLIDQEHHWVHREYTFCADGTLLVLYWADGGWAYDIVHANNARATSCFMARDSLSKAQASVKSHAEQSYGGVVKTF
jgi:hypothetical protein